MKVEEFVAQARQDRASDIHLVCGLTPRCRVDGAIREMGKLPLTEEECTAFAQELAGGEYGQARAVGEADLALSLAGVRCRVNLFRQQGSWSAAIRLLNEHIPQMTELGLPKVALEFPGYSQGLVLITGETGSGKSTTLAAVLNQINQTEYKHILTLEDPIEYVYTPDKCVINQREIGKDTQSFAAGLRAALREDPDVILVGEMRDLETIWPSGLRDRPHQLRRRLHRPYRGRVPRPAAAADPLAAVHVPESGVEPAASAQGGGRPGAGL